MKNQFFYTYEDQNKEQVMGSFNIEKIIKSYGSADGSRVVMLDDLHEQYMPVEVPNKQNKKITEMRKVEVCSQVHLNKEDAERFMEVTAVK